MTPNINKRVVREVYPSLITSNFGNASAPFVIGRKSYWITALLFELQVIYTVSSAAAAEDGFMRLITLMSLIGGGRTYLGSFARDQRLLYWATQLHAKGPGRLRVPDIQTSTAPTSVMTVPLLWIPSPEPVNPDGSVNLRAVEAAIQPDDDLTLQVNWAANSVLGTSGITVGAGTQMQVTAIGVLPDGNEQLSPYYPSWILSGFTPNSTSTGLGLVQPVPVNYHVRKIVTMFLKGSTTSQADVRANGGQGGTLNCVSEVGILDANNRKVTYYKTQVKSAESQIGFEVADDNSNLVDAGYTLAPGVSVTSTGGRVAGVLIWDLADITEHDAAPGQAVQSDLVYGVNLVGKATNSLNLGFTCDSTSNVYIGVAYLQYLPYQGSTAPIVLTTLPAAA